ncbi:septum site-determining protein MinC [Clostridium tertium]|jgi:septum site-determining protein MinC|uniref:Probable septum site-determining protein MinC n=1 Tax=Clostridium tertium TaxID=1559 RepID=A0A9X3XPD6_9CLOT|nr:MULTISPECIES: septum site-determining protein MinC [Clostridium]EEH99175.1 septum site-determining protein MinC [Clostridium sp. 7_2_43FAA]MBP1867690.1 septum site-determining protein MinC [Clostridium tertium]MBS5307319.1 septum site-determining protein MinC [Clostridium sp.]MBS5884767.1 septum site-determining protein MinC [Clostridium sp.]MBS6500838.1 septum site-determining protein MinC [Clostridium sp.]
MNDDRIQIKGTKEGINATIDMERFSDFDEMLEVLIDKLTAGKGFYKGASLKIAANLKNVNENDILRLKDVLFEKIQIKECFFEEVKREEQKESKIFSGVYEGKTKFIKKTIRGGQLVRYHGNIVIIGDINNGAEVYAGGNIIVLGTIKGQVHAGVGGNKKAIISAFSLQPEILQIAEIVTIAPEDGIKPSYPELAKIKDDIIVVEPYLPKKYI